MAQSSSPSPKESERINGPLEKPRCLTLMLSCIIGASLVFFYSPGYPLSEGLKGVSAFRRRTVHQRHTAGLLVLKKWLNLCFISGQTVYSSINIHT